MTLHFYVRKAWETRKRLIVLGGIEIHWNYSLTYTHRRLYAIHVWHPYICLRHHERPCQNCLSRTFGNTRWSKTRTGVHDD